MTVWDYEKFDTRGDCDICNHALRTYWLPGLGDRPVLVCVYCIKQNVINTLYQLHYSNNIYEEIRKLIENLRTEDPCLNCSLVTKSDYKWCNICINITKMYNNDRLAKNERLHEHYRLLVDRRKAGVIAPRRAFLISWYIRKRNTGNSFGRLPRDVVHIIARMVKDANYEGPAPFSYGHGSRNF